MSELNFNDKKAEKLYDQYLDTDDTEEQIDLLMQVVTLNPDHQSANYGLGFIYKYRNQWDLSLKYNQKAYKLDEEDEAARWNMAIAATALGEWGIAREVWLKCGVKIKNEAGPVDANCGSTPVRINPGELAEVVWGTRIDPARTRINNIPYKESGFRFGDVVLNDGAPVGYKVSDGKEYPILNVLQLLQASEFTTYTCDVVINSDDDIESLDEIMFESGHEIEDWTQSVKVFCKQCSEGTTHAEHDEELEEELEEEWVAERTLGVATKSLDEAKSIITSWAKENSCKIISFE